MTGVAWWVGRVYPGRHGGRHVYQEGYHQGYIGRDTPPTMVHRKGYTTHHGTQEGIYPPERHITRDIPT